MEVIKKETYDGRKAKILKVTLDEKKNTCEEVEDTDGEWVSSRKTRKRKNSQDL